MTKIITKEEFERAYARRSNMTVEQLHHLGLNAVSCDCDKCDKCDGWKIVSDIGDTTNDTIRAKILEEVYNKYQRAPYNIGIWLYNEILKACGSDQLPILQIGEIVFYFCEQCGNDFLCQPAKCDCGCVTFKQLGTQQGRVWRKKKTFENLKRKL